MNDFRLRYTYLNKEEQFVYGLFLEALRKKATECDISGVKKDVNLVMVLNAVLGDYPEIIYFDKSEITTIESLFGKKLSFAGCMNKRQAEQYDDQLRKALEDAVWEIDKNAKNDKEILMGISEFLQRNVEYDMEESNRSSRKKSKSPMSHNAYGALVNHKAVCDGFSSAYSLIAQYFGMRCMVIEGKSSYQSMENTGHAWNIIEYDNAYYHIDSTWDANIYHTTQYYSYDYFGLDDNEIAVDHEWDIHTAPKCDSNKLSYFLSNGLYAYSESQIEDIILKKMKYRNKVIRLKISPSVALVGDVEKYLDKILNSVKSRSYVRNSYHYLWNSELRCLTIMEEN